MNSVLSFFVFLFLSQRLEEENAHLRLELQSRDDLIRVGFYFLFIIVLLLIIIIIIIIITIIIIIAAYRRLSRQVDS